MEGPGGQRDFIGPWTAGAVGLLSPPTPLTYRGLMWLPSTIRSEERSAWGEASRRVRAQSSCTRLAQKGLARWEAGVASQGRASGCPRASVTPSSSPCPRSLCPVSGGPGGEDSLCKVWVQGTGWYTGGAVSQRLRSSGGPGLAAQAGLSLPHDCTHFVKITLLRLNS